MQTFETEGGGRAEDHAVGSGLHGEKSHVGVKMCSADVLGWGWWQVQTLQNLMVKSFVEVPILAACLKPHPLN